MRERAERRVANLMTGATAVASTTACGLHQRPRWKGGDQATTSRKGAVVGTKIVEVMTDRPRAVTPQTSVRDAARLMEEEDVGSLPVVEEGARLVGIVTDRDVAIRVVGHGLDPDSTPVGKVATSDLVALTPDHYLDESLRVTAHEQSGRLPIVDR